MTEKIKDEKNIKDFNINLEEMSLAGLHFGHKTSRINPKMEPYISGTKNNVHIIDLEKTKEKLEEALDFIEKLILENKILIIVGTKIQHKELVKNLAESCDLPYINNRWVGGTFTNFNVIKKRINYFKELENKKAKGELEKYTKKERLIFDKELKELELKFKGIKNLERIPDAIFIVDIKKDHLAAKEARRKGVKIIAISDTNCDPTLADYPIPANDDAISSVKYILEKVAEVIQNTKKKLA